MEKKELLKVKKEKLVETILNFNEIEKNYKTVIAMKEEELKTAKVPDDSVVVPKQIFNKLRTVEAEFLREKGKNEMLHEHIKNLESVIQKNYEIFPQLSKSIETLTTIMLKGSKSDS